jgi:hypothetical protein
LDDIPFGGAEQGRDQADLTARLRDYLGDRASLILVPTEYVGTRATPYLDELAKGVPPDVPIAWTGSMVVNERITAEEADARAAALGGAAPLIWDNYPVNDSLMSDRLHLGPLWGRERALVDVCSGYLANPMVQPNASKLPLASVGAWLRGEDALDAWAEAADELGARVLAEACDGAVPGALVASAIEWIDEDDYVEEHVGALRQWLQAASCCEAGALGDEVTRWVEQARKEAVVGLHALKLIDLARAGRFDKVVEQGWLVAFNARELRRAPVSVMGSRWGFQPALGQRHDGTWSFHVSSMLEDANAIDDLVRAAISFASVRSTS